MGNKNYSRKLIDLTGKKFGRWTVIKNNGKTKQGENLWLCQCSCEKKTIRNVRGVGLRNGTSRSCDCLQREKAAQQGRNRKIFNEYFVFDKKTMGGYPRLDKKNVFYFDKKDFDLIKNYTWRVNNKGYIYTQEQNDGIKKIFTLQTLLLNFPKRKVDHMDRNPLNNRRNNLRLATNKQNGRNISISFDNTSGFIGVCKAKFFVENVQMWRARINVNGKELSKSFKKKKDAVIQRLKWELQYWGLDFAPQRHLFKEYGII